MSRLAQLYDWSVPLHRGAVRAAVRLADAAPGERLLDVATGTGALLRELACDAWQPVHAVGVDRSPAMLSVASHPARPWPLVQADARALPFRDASFDIVTVSYLLHLIDDSDRARVLREVRRVVRPHGRVVLVTVDARRPLVRSFLAALPSWTGLRRVDLGMELDAAGLRLVQACYPKAVWPSICLRAEALDGRRGFEAPP
jgi:ubiquinone/menaquinone biosynthesis C-methylase UbiE